MERKNKSSPFKGDRRGSLCFIVSLCLIIGGFFCPPIGIIDGSVLTAVGELLAFAALAQVPEVIKAGKSLKISSGSFSAEIEKDDKDR